MLLFEGNPGRVVAVTDPAAAGMFAVANVATAPITYDVQKSIITRLTVGQRVNMQFLHTFGQYVYIYVFGDRIGSVSLSGLSFASNSCPPLTDTSHGGELMMDWYKANKASARQTPIRVSIGARSNIDGFVSDFGFDVVDPMTQIGQWTLNLMGLPDPA